MGDFVASDVTVTCPPAGRCVLPPKTKLNFINIAFGNTSLTIPAGGIPLPAKGFFGMNKDLAALVVISGYGPYQFVYDPDNHALLVYHGDYSASSDGPHVHATGVAIVAQTLQAIAIGK